MAYALMKAPVAYAVVAEDDRDTLAPAGSAAAAPGA
jgi:hypothetical protein